MSEFALGAARSTGAFRRRRDSLSLCVTPRDECPSSRQPMPLSETMLRVNKAPTRLPPRCFRHRAFVFARGNAQRENNETVFSGRLLHRPGSSFHKIVKLRTRNVQSSCTCTYEFVRSANIGIVSFAPTELIRRPNAQSTRATPDALAFWRMVCGLSNTLLRQDFRNKLSVLYQTCSRTFCLFDRTISSLQQRVVDMKTRGGLTTWLINTFRCQGLLVFHFLSRIPLRSFETLLKLNLLETLYNTAQSLMKTNWNS